MMAFEIVPVPIADFAFEPYGTYFDLRSAGPRGVESVGSSWVSRRTVADLIDTTGSLGLAVGATLPAKIQQMERHFRTEEALFCLERPFVLAIAKPSDAPLAESIRCVRVDPGEVVVIDRGVWHDACYGLDEPTPYYWFAACDPDEEGKWTPVVGEVVIIDD